MLDEATIKLYRRWNYLGMFMPWTLYVDNQKVGKIANGKHESFNVAPGNPSLYVKGALWAKTKKIDVHLNPGEAKSFECGVPWSYWLWVGLALVMLVGQQFLIHSGYAAYSTILILLVFLIMVILSLLAIFKSGFVYYLKEIQESQLP